MKVIVNPERAGIALIKATNVYYDVVAGQVRATLSFPTIIENKASERRKLGCGEEDILLAPTPVAGVATDIRYWNGEARVLGDGDSVEIAVPVTDSALTLDAKRIMRLVGEAGCDGRPHWTVWQDQWGEWHAEWVGSGIIGRQADPLGVLVDELEAERGRARLVLPTRTLAGHVVDRIISLMGARLAESLGELVEFWRLMPDSPRNTAGYEGIEVRWTACSKEASEAILTTIREGWTITVHPNGRVKVHLHI